MVLGILHESWLGEVVPGWDRVTKLNAYEEGYLSWILLLRDETLVQETKYLASHFCFSGIMLRRNLEYLRILRSANRWFVLSYFLLICKKLLFQLKNVINNHSSTSDSLKYTKSCTKKKDMLRPFLNLELTWEWTKMETKIFTRKFRTRI